MRHTPHPGRRKVTRLAAGAAALFLCALGLAACSSSGTAASQRSDIIFGRAMDVTTLDISRSLCDTCQIYNSAVYETLLRANPKDGSLEPLLAKDWKANADSTVFTFHLRDNAVFADGSPVEAKDVKWSWDRLQNLAGSPSYFMAGITSVEAPDAHTVVVTSKAPNSAFPNITTASYMGVINSDVAAAHGATADKNAAKTDKAEPWFLKHSAGSGQYVLSDYEQGSQLVLTRNDKYWGHKASFSKVTIKEVTDSSAQLQQLQRGDIDVAMQLSFDALNQVKDDSNLKAEVVPSYNFVYIALCPGVAGGEALKDPRVREAFRMGIDYDTVIKDTVAGHGKRQSTGIANGFEGTADLPLPAYDPARAKELLAQAGYGHGLNLEVVYPNTTIYGVNFTSMFQSIQQSLKNVGIDVKLTPIEFSSWVDRVEGKGMPVTAVYFAPDHPDTIQYVQYFARIAGSVWGKRAGLSVDQEQNRLAAAALSQSGKQREQTYAHLGQLMYNDAFILPIVNPMNLLASRADVVGNNYDITRNVDLSTMSFKK
jgi:peptide/nickel transport system substrate-binding protein